MRKIKTQRYGALFILMISVALVATGCFWKKQEAVTGTNTSSKGENMVLIGKAEGSTVTISKISLAAPGFVAIHADSGTGRPGTVVGVSGYLSQGTSSNLDIQTTQKLFSGAKYFATLRVDNGDQQWLAADDVVVKDNSGIAIQQEFMVASDTMDQPSASTTVVKVIGRNYAFDKQEIRVKKGSTVRIEFTSDEGFHDWTIDEFNASTNQVSTGGTSAVEFVANKNGSFEYYCSVGEHRKLGMVGTLVVE